MDYIVEGFELRFLQNLDHIQSSAQAPQWKRNEKRVDLDVHSPIMMWLNNTKTIQHTVHGTKFMTKVLHVRTFEFFSPGMQRFLLQEQ